MKNKDINAIYTNSGEKRIVNSQELNKLLYTDDIQFYTTWDTLKDWMWNRLLNRWEYQKTF